MPSSPLGAPYCSKSWYELVTAVRWTALAPEAKYDSVERAGAVELETGW